MASNLIYNSYVVPYNRELSMRSNAHINIEIFCHSTLTKYHSKGDDMCQIYVQRENQDEIKTNLNCHFICPCEAVWRLLQFPIHSRTPAGDHLQVHLPLHQNIVFPGHQPLPSALRRPGFDWTMLTEWFQMNINDPSAYDLYYSQFPNKYV